MPSSNHPTNHDSPEIPSIGILSSLAWGHRVSQSSVSWVVSAVCDALSCQVRRFIKFPSTEAEQVSTTQKFIEVANFPNVVCAVDGTSVAIKVSDDDRHSIATLVRSTAPTSKHVYISLRNVLQQNMWNEYTHSSHTQFTFIPATYSIIILLFI